MCWPIALDMDLLWYEAVPPVDKKGKIKMINGNAQIKDLGDKYVFWDIDGTITPYGCLVQFKTVTLCNHLF